ncbi:MAG TPA: peptidoglycan-binding protein [Leptolyngbya sp.]|nr:peptidoglycan-binding protein [Leptolyngbya sp.]
MEPSAPLANQNKSLHLSLIALSSIRVLSAIGGCVIVGFASVAMAQIVLKQGDTGTAVSELQDRLRALGCYDGSTTEFFGEQTRDAVIQCQQQRGIPADGIVGTETYRALGLGSSSTGTGSARYGDRLQLGDRGAGVSELQTRLQAKGYYSGTIDGIFGSGTQSAVIQLQQDSGYSQTGVVDNNVYAALDGSTSPTPLPGTPTLQIGDQNSRVTELQQQLSQMGYPVPPTGYFGTQTQQAVLNFQRAQGLPETGAADAPTIAAIRTVAGGGVIAPQNSRSYVVIIPIPDQTALNRVQNFIPDAVPRQSRLGNFVRAGAYTTPEAAERRAETFRSQGLRDARVVFE